MKCSPETLSEKFNSDYMIVTMIEKNNLNITLQSFNIENE